MLFCVEIALLSVDYGFPDMISSENTISSGFTRSPSKSAFSLLKFASVSSKATFPFEV